MNVLVELLPEQEEQIRKQIQEILISELEKLSNTTTCYMNKKQTCTYLNISNNTLDNWIQQGLPVIRIGNSVRFDRKTIDKWLSTLEK
ncbi:helix-turn-helix domain-containing protein [Streptococcus thoraltensis]|uniref:helix-turn-helix domain-containing protein n=1 Tax=Streptococcus thoraltensis TaxID=55085 RepID=UPI001F57FECA|nr:helix-turn-helix domain-containing protein [Streptococcus thoraltensis]